MTVGINGFGTTIAGSVTAALGKVKKIAFPEVGVEILDDTDLSNADAVRTKFAGAKDYGDCACTATYNKTDSPPLYGAAGLANETWTVTLKDGSTLVFDGFISAAGGGDIEEGKIVNSFTITISGAVVFTAGA